MSAFTYAVDVQQQWKSQLVLGFQPPTWSWLQSVRFQIELAAPRNSARGFRIVSGHLYLQNRAPVDSAFMRACERGDIPLMTQYPIDQPWALRDRAITTGEALLLMGFAFSTDSKVHCSQQIGLTIHIKSLRLKAKAFKMSNGFWNRVQTSMVGTMIKCKLSVVPYIIGV